GAKMGDDDVRPGAPGLCNTVAVSNPQSAAGWVKVNTNGVITGTAPAGAMCVSTPNPTTKCASPGATSCGLSTPLKRCRNAWIEVTVGALTNPCGCVCAP